MDNLLSDLAIDPAEAWVLWYRRDERAKWKIVGAAPTKRDLLNAMDQVGSGDFLRLPAGEEPGTSKQF